MLPQMNKTRGERIASGMRQTRRTREVRSREVPVDDDACELVSERQLPRRASSSVRLRIEDDRETRPARAAQRSMTERDSGALVRYSGDEQVDAACRPDDKG